MHLHPADRPLLLYGLLEFFNLDRLLFQDGMAVHADAGWRNTGVPAGPRRIVAVEARNFVIAGVHLVRKCDRLLWRIPLVDADSRQLPCASPNCKTHAHNSHKKPVEPHSDLVFLRPEPCGGAVLARPCFQDARGGCECAAQKSKRPIQTEYYKGCQPREGKDGDGGKG